MKNEYEGIVEIETEDPLKFSHNDCNFEILDYQGEDCFISGCDAGIGQINMYSNGDITPCALFNERILNLDDVSVVEAKEIYKRSQLIQDMLIRNYSLKCQNCSSFKFCGGGCRAIPFGLTGNYKGFDNTCFKHLIDVKDI